MTVPFTFNADGSLRLSGAGVTLFTLDENPNGNITGLQAGDLCLTPEPALYQWSADATPVWVPISGFNGSYTGTSGITLADNSSDGITLIESTGGDGDYGIGISGGTVGFYNGGGGALLLSGDGTVQLGGAISLFTSDGDPNGSIAGKLTGDLCVTDDPALYQWNGNLATPAWVLYELISTPEAIYHFDFVTASPFGGIYETGTVKLVGGDTPGPEYVDFTVSVPSFTYSSGQIAGPMNMNMFQLPSSSHAFAVQVIVAVASPDGANSLVVNIVTTGSPNAANLQFNNPLGATLTQVGTDLTWDDTFSTITSAAGGLYGIMISFQTHWV